MDALPSEIIEHILSCNVLDFRDVINFSSTCTKFRQLVNDSFVIWKYKFHQIEPPLPVTITTDDWKIEFIARFKTEKILLEVLNAMSLKYYRKPELTYDDFLSVNMLLDTYVNAYHYIMSFLLKLRTLHPMKMLTTKYYGELLFTLLKEQKLIKDWGELKAMAEGKKTLEAGILFGVDWFQVNKESCQSDLVRYLDSMADSVISCVAATDSDHPLLKVPTQVRQEWGKQNLNDNMFPAATCREILTACHHVFFVEKRYYANQDETFSPDFTKLYQSATRIVLCVFYESVARRVGVKLDIVFFPGHCLVRWKESYQIDSSSYQYVAMEAQDTFLRGQCPGNRVPTGQCPVKRVGFPAATMEQVLNNAVYNMYLSRNGEDDSNSSREALELLTLLAPSDFTQLRNLSRFYMSHDMDVTALISRVEETQPIFYTSQSDKKMVEHLIHQLRCYHERRMQNRYFGNHAYLRNRHPTVLFAVGMIGRHKLFDYTGVVYGWDVTCKATLQWITEMGVNNLTYGQNQPFYNVLVDDGSRRYVAQENLQVAHSPPHFSHPLIGRYFDEYCVTHYKPNKELATDYPEDRPILEALLCTGR